MAWGGRGLMTLLLGAASVTLSQASELDPAPDLRGSSSSLDSSEEACLRKLHELDQRVGDGAGRTRFDPDCREPERRQAFLLPSAQACLASLSDTVLAVEPRGGSSGPSPEVRKKTPHNLRHNPIPAHLGPPWGGVKAV